MTAPKLPDGRDAWFVSVRTRKGISVRPCSRAGWVVTIAFVVANMLFATVLSVIILVAPRLALVIGIATFPVVTVILFLIFVFRTSVRQP